MRSLCNALAMKCFLLHCPLGYSLYEGALFLPTFLGHGTGSAVSWEETYVPVSQGTCTAQKGFKRTMRTTCEGHSPINREMNRDRASGVPGAEQGVKEWI